MAGPFADDERCQEFVENLVSLRGTKGWTQQKLAEECHWSVSTVSNFESFQRAPLVEHGVALDKAFGLKRMFTVKAQEIQDGASYAPEFRSFAEAEKTATDLFIWEHSFCPGLFQTEKYAFEVLRRHPGVSEGLARERATARLARQDILTRDDAPRVWALLDESVLRFRFGDAGTMYGQMMRLLEVSDLPNVTIQVVPGMEGHVGRLGAFAYAEGPGQASIVNVDDITDGRVREEASVIQHVQLTFRAMQTQALHVKASRDLIAKIAEELWRTTATPDGVRALTAAPTAGTA